MFKGWKILASLSVILFLVACSKDSEPIVQKTYVQLSSSQKSEISGERGSSEQLILTKKDESAYRFSKKYLGKKVFAIHFNANKDLMGEVIYLVDNGKIIGENLRD